MKDKKKYIIERWIKIEQVYETKEKATEQKEFLEKYAGEDCRDIKIYEVETNYKELK
jgi:hypothetical protein